MKKSLIARFITSVLAGVRNDRKRMNMKITRALPSKPKVIMHVCMQPSAMCALADGGGNFSQNGLMTATKSASTWPW